MAKNTKTPAMVLQELSVQRKTGPPAYEIIYSITGTHENRFDYRVTVCGIEAQGTGSSKQVSKHKAAHNALMKLKELGIYNPTENPVQEFQAPLQKNAPLQNSVHECSFKVPNCIGPLKDLCLENKIPDPIFILISDVGPPHSKEFTFECNVASIKTLATGSTKKMAKQLAAQDMLDRIKDIIPDIAAQYTKSSNCEAISDKDNTALKTYNEFFGTIVPNKAVKMEDYSKTLRKIMDECGITFEKFYEEFNDRDEEALNHMLEKLGLTCHFYHMQDNPILISLSLSTDTPFTVIGMSDNSQQEARSNAIASAFEVMEVFMDL